MDIRYNDVLYATGPERISNVVCDKLENIHKMLFNDALEKYFEESKENEEDTFDDFLRCNKIIEKRGQVYNEPSNVIIREKKFPYKQKNVDLSQWWSTYQFDESNKDISELIEDEEVLIDAKLIYVDYARNRCKFRSKMTGKEFWTTLDYINENTKIDEDNMTLKDTFGDLCKNIDL